MQAGKMGEKIRAELARENEPYLRELRAREAIK
jgi:hypothetical protein